MSESNKLKIVVLNGPNLNLLGTREPSIYGHNTLKDIENMCVEYCAKNDIELVAFKQSNHEGVLVDLIQSFIGKIDGLVINAAAYTHTSVAIHDALKMLDAPIIEVHLSDPSTRESFRHLSYIEPVATSVVKGKGANGYVEALEVLRQR